MPTNACLRVRVWEQDFEIAGSGCGGAGGGGRSPAGTELTERSWDSHAQYRRVPLPHPRPLAPLYCRLRHLLTLQGAASALLVVRPSVRLRPAATSLRA